MGDLTDRFGQLTQRLGTELRSLPRRSRRWHDASERTQRRRRSERRELAGRTPVTSIDVVCVTSRPQHLDVIADSFRAQTHPSCGLIVVVNGNDLDAGTVESALGDVADEILVRRDISLGECLNAGIERSSSRFVAKWDDDDWYGPHYLADHLEAWQTSEAAIVGKHSYFAYLERTDRTIVRFPGHEHRRSDYVAGGTLFLDRDQLPTAPFADLSIGEDGALLRSAAAVGRQIYSAGRFGYVQRRDGNNTWTIDDARFARRSLDLGAGLQLDRAMI